MAEEITVVVNGKQKSFAAGATLYDVVLSYQVEPSKVVVEYNLEIIPSAKLSEQVIAQDDKIEIVHFVGGG